MRKVACLFLIICLFVSLSACETATGYPQFNFGDFDKCKEVDFLTDPSLEYLRYKNCAFVPNMRAINHQEYAIDFIVYSADSECTVKLDIIEIINNDEQIISALLDCTMPWKQIDQGVYSGTIRSITIPMDSVEFKDGDKIQINIHVSVITDESVNDGILVFNGVVWQYVTIVFPV